MPFVSLLVIALTIVALIDVITRDDSQVKHAPKMVWIIVVILLPLIGSALWFALGREYGDGGIAVSMPRRAARLTRRAAPEPQQWPAPTEARSTEQQIADLDREIEEWRLRQEIESHKRERGGPDSE